eukprot:CAMPEP_0114313814 /NCGR_PEP_ID=MMETSP0059-20121206/21374_1 /TAXON_ID=36894 /ORGANISM="Pyramimonas parkeae, Strain CCMP726" /LENGTH=113 /DNA_ID=CAMNT_0001438711 /DNA_START=211 /DNA_END=547 /DNA_ORIENTATION=+
MKSMSPHVAAPRLYDPMANTCTSTQTGKTTGGGLGVAGGSEQLPPGVKHVPKHLVRLNLQEVSGGAHLPPGDTVLQILEVLEANRLLMGQVGTRTNVVQRAVAGGVPPARCAV